MSYILILFWTKLKDNYSLQFFLVPGLKKTEGMFFKREKRGGLGTMGPKVIVWLPTDEALVQMN